MKIYGTKASPYVRRLRILLDEKAEFETIDLYSPEGREQFKQISPVLKVPVVEIDNRYLYDSRVIFNELCNKGFHRELSFELQNQLTMIDAITDAFVQRLILKRSNVELPNESIFYSWNEQRIKECLEYLDTNFKNTDDYVSISLFTTIDWALYRSLYNFEKYNQLMHFYIEQYQNPKYELTNPRN